MSCLKSLLIHSMQILFYSKHFQDYIAKDQLKHGSAIVNEVIKFIQEMNSSLSDYLKPQELVDVCEKYSKY